MDTSYIHKHAAGKAPLDNTMRRVIFPVSRSDQRKSQARSVRLLVVTSCLLSARMPFINDPSLSGGFRSGRLYRSFLIQRHSRDKRYFQRELVPNSHSMLLSIVSASSHLHVSTKRLICIILNSISTFSVDFR